MNNKLDGIGFALVVLVLIVAALNLDSAVRGVMAATEAGNKAAGEGYSSAVFGWTCVMVGAAFDAIGLWMERAR